MTIPRVGMEVVVTFQEGDPDQPLIIGCVASKVMSVAHPLPRNKTRTVLRSRSSAHSGGYNELSIEDRVGLETIHVRAQRDMEQLILNDSHCLIGNDRVEQVDGNSTSLIKGQELHTTEGLRSTVVGADALITINGNSSTTTAGTLVIQAAEQARITAADVVVDAGMGLTLATGGHHLVINAAGIFSSVPIVEGGAPMVGAPPLQALQAAADTVNAGIANPAPALPEPSSTQEHETQELEEEEEEVEEEGITLRIGVFFDGTGNNRSNSESVAGCHARDVDLLEEAEDIQRFCQMHGYASDGSAPDNSFGNDTSNVAKLHDLYTDDSQRQLGDEETVGFISVYLDGIGTRSGEADALFSQATGVGGHGVLARVEQSPLVITEKLQWFHLSNPTRDIARIEFDIFGFSRGAAAARHFANEVMKGSQSIVACALTGAPGFVEGFNWNSKTDVSISFIGIFDTAAAIADIAEGDLSIHDAINPGVNLYLAPDIAKKIVHLVAKDERRHNFSLNSAGAADIRLPGAHSDVGGGYIPNIIERVLLSKPHCSRDVDFDIHSTDTSAYRWAEHDLGRVQDQLHLYGLPLEVRTWSIETSRNVKGDRSKSKNVYAAVHSCRVVRNDLALVYLRIMRELAVRHDVPFEFIHEEDRKFALPAELKPIAEKLMAYALGKTRSASLSVSEEALLYERYIHLSANWNAAKGWNSSDLDIVFINRPAVNYARVVHPNAKKLSLN